MTAKTTFFWVSDNALHVRHKMYVMHYATSQIGEPSDLQTPNTAGLLIFVSVYPYRTLSTFL